MYNLAIALMVRQVMRGDHLIKLSTDIATILLLQEQYINRCDLEVINVKND